MRPARALIDLRALRHNYRLARRLAGGRALAVVKADAYGHGAVRCAQALDAEADGFAVACIEEALALREAGIRAPILLLEGVFEPEELDLVVEHALWLVAASPRQVDAIARFRPRRPLQVWLKLDSGMHRLGLSVPEFRAAHARLHGLPHVGAVVMMSHMARADEPDCDATEVQYRRFRDATAGLAGATSLCNSPTLLGWPAVRGDWGRPGLMLYGADPFPAGSALSDRLEPVMTLESAVIAVRELAAGEPLGYGAAFVAERPTRVGVVAMGYADGYPQFAPAGTPVRIGSAPGRLIGRVSMDMLTVDLGPCPAADVGTPVRLWGAAPRAAALAAGCATSVYGLLCGLKRVPRVYLDG